MDIDEHENPRANTSQALSAVTKSSPVTWDIPTSYKKGMLVPARIFATQKLLQEMDAGVFEQVTNVACLPGIQKHAYCMPDGHWGYGFPIGGVAAMDVDEGVISPGGIGFDINCGMRLVTTNLLYKDVEPKLKQLVETLFRHVPSGVGAKGFVKLTQSEFSDVVTTGPKWCIDHDLGWDEDLERTEESGCITNANPEKISDKAVARGINQLGTLGSGNHYLEVQIAGNIFDEKVAKKFGIIDQNQVVVMLHCGSRGFGHQVATDYLLRFNAAMQKYGITVNDRELACAPFQSDEGQDYYQAMAGAANMAFANRQVIVHRIRECFSSVFGKSAEDLAMHQVYDVAHNIAKVENHKVDGKMRKLVVHRKGATRCFGPGEPEVPSCYENIGQPVIIGGSMETGSYLLVGMKGARDQTFGSTAHGSGRTMSRAAAKKQVRGEALQQEMAKRGIFVKSASMPGLAEEAGFAYKDISAVVDTMEQAGVSKKVVALRPIGNVKG
ncbi:RtcB family protein [Candidatus Woesearchaeota archaeon]|nr:RtcB family protein [Candidatus Woesearchaeota archaeon]